MEAKALKQFLRNIPDNAQVVMSDKHIAFLYNENAVALNIYGATWENGIGYPAGGTAACGECSHFDCEKCHSETKEEPHSKRYVECRAVNDAIRKLSEEPGYQHEGEDFYSGLFAVEGKISLLSDADVIPKVEGDFLRASQNLYEAKLNELEAELELRNTEIETLKARTEVAKAEAVEEVFEKIDNLLSDNRHYDILIGDVYEDYYDVQLRDGIDALKKDCNI